MANKKSIINLGCIFFITAIATSGVYLVKQAITQSRNVDSQIEIGEDGESTLLISEGPESVEEHATTVQPSPSHWENEVGGIYENRGLSKINRIGDDYLLTTYCDGIHSVYIKDDKKFNLQNYTGKFVNVSYRYVEEVNRDVKCIKAPCEPVTERRIVIEKIEEVSVSEDELMEFKTKCLKINPG
jgi:hypothetical protein